MSERESDEAKVVCPECGAENTLVKQSAGGGVWQVYQCMACGAVSDYEVKP